MSGGKFAFGKDFPVGSFFTMKIIAVPGSHTGFGIERPGAGEKEEGEKGEKEKWFHVPKVRNIL